jgi:hypothetical protein
MAGSKAGEIIDINQQRLGRKRQKSPRPNLPHIRSGILALLAMQTLATAAADSRLLCYAKSRHSS